MTIKDIKALHEYEDNYYYVPDDLKDYLDGEVSMLIIDKKLRGVKVLVRIYYLKYLS